MSINNPPQGNAQFQQLAQAFPFLQTLYSQGTPSPLGQNPFYNWYTPGRQPGAMTNFPLTPPQGPGNLIAPPVGAQAPTIFPQGQAAGIPPGPALPNIGMNPGQSAFPGVPPPPGPAGPGAQPMPTPAMPGMGPMPNLPGMPSAPRPGQYPGQVSTPVGGTATPPPPAALFPPPAAPQAPAAPAAPPTPTGPPGMNEPLTQAMLLQLYPWMAAYGGPREPQMGGGDRMGGGGRFG
jgi:hypothetical protein